MEVLNSSTRYGANYHLISNNYRIILNIGILTLDLNSTSPNCSRCFFSNYYYYLLLKYNYILICATCATSSTWQGHICHFMDIGKHGLKL